MAVWRTQQMLNLAPGEQSRAVQRPERLACGLRVWQCIYRYSLEGFLNVRFYIYPSLSLRPLARDIRARTASDGYPTTHGADRPLPVGSAIASYAAFLHLAS